MEVESYIIDNISGKPRPLRIVFDTGAYMTVIDRSTLLRAGYNVNKGNNAEFDVVGRNRVPAKEVLLNVSFAWFCTINPIQSSASPDGPACAEVSAVTCKPVRSLPV